MNALTQRNLPRLCQAALFLTLVLGLGSCTLYFDADRSLSPGKLLSITFIKQVGDFDVGLAWMLAGGPEPRPQLGGMVDIYRLEYGSTTPLGQPTLLSALLALPAGMTSLKAFLVYNHGTVWSAAEAPSVPSLEGPPMAAIYADKGMAVLMPDYLGLGSSREMPNYMMAESTAQNVVDALLAARTALTTTELNLAFPAKLFLSGGSQGGQVSMAVKNRLKILGDPQLLPDAVAMAAGVYWVINPDWRAPQNDSRVFVLENALAGQEDTYSMYLGYCMLAYCTYYGGDLESMLLPEWAAVAREYLNGSKTTRQIYDRFKGWRGLERYEIIPSMILQPSFVKAVADWRSGTGPAPWIVERLAENFVIQGETDIPIRLYYGDRDRIATSAEVQASVERLGSLAQAISVGDYGHSPTMIRALVPIRDWFLELAEQP